MTELANSGGYPFGAREFYEPVQDGRRFGIAHRGGDGAGARNENTLAAFSSALTAGVLYGETDVVVTADGELIAFHGSETEEEASRTGIPTRQALQAMEFKAIQGRAQEWTDGEPVPRFVELLRGLPGMRWFVDPKTPESVAPLAEAISATRAVGRVSIGAFNYKRTADVAARLGGPERVCTCLGELGARMTFVSRYWPVSLLAKPYLRHTKATSLQLPHSIVATHPSIVVNAHELGMRVIVWANRPEDDTEGYMRRALELGVDGVMSDHTNSLVKVFGRLC